MSESLRNTADEQQAHQGRHRGAAASGEDAGNATRGRHRRPSDDAGRNG